MYIFPCLLKFGTFYSFESKIFFAIELCKSLAFRENDHLHMFNANWFRLLVPRKDCQVGWHRCFCAISRRTNHTNRWHLFSFIWAGRWCFCFQLLRIFLVYLITVWQQLFFLPRRLPAEMMLFPILLFLASGEELHSCVLFCSDNHLLRFCFCVVIFWVLLPIRYQCLFAVAFRKLAIERQSI